MPRNDLRAEEPDRRDILERRGLDPDRHEALARVVEDDQVVVVERHGPEEARLGVGHGLEFTVCDLEAEDVRDTRVIGAAEKVTAVGREHETLGDGLAQVQLRDGLEFAVEQACCFEYLERLVALDVTEGPRQ